MPRIAKIISGRGVCSRRQAETLIDQGVVKVNGRIITSPALNFPEEAEIQINGETIAGKKETALFAYHKPRGYVVSRSDERGRPTIFDNLKDNDLITQNHLIPIGRLDIETEGLLLLTNDGDLARQMELPSSRLERVYKVRAYGDFDTLVESKGDIIVQGIIYKAPVIKLLRGGGGKNNWFEVKLIEGKNREIRNIFAHFGLKISRLIRTNFGAYALSNLPAGEVKMLTKNI